MENTLWVIGLISMQAFAQTAFPEGASVLANKEMHASLLGKAFATKNTNGKGKAVGDTIEFKANGVIAFVEGPYKGNFVFDGDAYRDDLTWQGNDGRYCSEKYKWCMYLATQDASLLTRWGSEDGKNKPVLVWSDFSK
jgi:hypothetical protein